MLLTISTTYRPATDLGYLLHKNPARFQTFPLSFGQARVFYPEASEDHCRAVLLLEVDPVGLVRRRGPAGEAFALQQYVNDRSYVASSFLSVALAQVFGSALGGRSKDRPELADAAIPLRAELPVLPCRGGEPVLRRLFEPLGYEVTARRHPLDEAFPEWGESRYFTVGLQAVTRLRDLLTHLYVLLPVLDDDKHYWIGDDEVEKLLRHGSGWLALHPERGLITERYLKHRRPLTRAAFSRLAEEDSPDPDSAQEEHAAEEERAEERVPEAGTRLHEQRIGAVLAVLKGCNARRVVDLGCGEGRLLQALLADGTFEAIAGMDVSSHALASAEDRLRLDHLAPRQRERITLFQGSLMYRDRRLEGFDAATVVEVVEHLDPPRLAAFERVLFEYARPGTAILTTPNAEYNARFESLPAGAFRHRDHRFEWTRAELASWAARVAGRFGYGVRFLPIGPEDPALGAPTQMAVFTRD